MNDEKIYCGNGKEITTQYGQLLKLSFSQKDVKTLLDNLKNGWVNAVVKERREPSETGVTHYLTIDLWEPKKKEEAEVVEAIEEPIKSEFDDELPF